MIHSESSRLKVQPERHTATATFTPPLSVLGAVALFALLAVGMTWPLVLDLDHSVIGWVGDNFYFVWLVGWFQQSLVELHHLPLLVPHFNHPEGWNLAYNEVTPAMVLVGLPASLAGGPTLGYNLSILLSFVLSGLGVHLWVRRLTGNFAAGIIAGTLFAFAPYRMSHLFGHFNLMGTQWFPFYFMSLASLLEARTSARKSALLSALFLGLIALTSQYYLYMTLILSGVFVVGYGLFVNRRILFLAAFWRRLGAFALLAMPLIIVAIAPYLQLADAGNLAPRTFEDVRGWSASPTDFLLPSPRHFIWGRWIEQHFDRTLWIENTLYVGVVALATALLALAWRRQAPRLGGWVSLFALTMAAAWVLALGVDLHWLGRSVEVGVPQWIQRWHPYPRTFIPLPGYFLFKGLPFYDGMRVWMRYGIFVNLFVSLLAGVGVTWLLQRLGRRLAQPVALLLLLLVLVDFYPGPLQLSPVEGRAVDYWLAEQASGSVMQFPISQATTPEQTYYTLVHGKPFVGGFFAAFAPPQFQRIQPVLAAFPDEASIALLKTLGVRWVLVDSTQYDNIGAVRAALEGSGLHLATILDGQHLYELAED